MRTTRPQPSDLALMAIARLLMLRASAGEFGRDVFGRPPGVWIERGLFSVCSPQDLEFPARCLDAWRASAVALGEFQIDQVPPLSKFEFVRFPDLHEPFLPFKKPVVRESYCTSGKKRSNMQA